MPATSTHAPAGRCPHCDYPIDPGRCPECGKVSARSELLAPQAPGWSRREIAALCTLLIVLVGGYSAYRWLDPFPLLPTWMLLPCQGDAKARSTLELTRRFTRGSLARAEVRRLFQNALAPWPIHGFATDPPRTLIPAGHPWTLRRWPYPNCRLPGIAPSGFGVLENERYRILVDEREVKWKECRDQPDLLCVDAVDLPVGMHSIMVILCLDLRWGGQVESLSSTQTIQVVVEDKPVSAYVEAVRDESVRAALMAAIDVSITRRGDIVNFKIQPRDRLPVPLLGRLGWAGAQGVQWSRRWDLIDTPKDAIWRNQHAFMSRLAGPGGELPFVQIHLSPISPDEALLFPEIKRYFGAPLVWKNVPVNKAD